MKILYLGNFRPEHSTENHIAKTLEAMGHFVARFQEDETSYDILLAQEGFDFYLYTRTWDNVKTINATKLDFLAKKKIPLVGFHLDIWWGLDREKQIEQQLYFKSDILFTADGGHQDRWAEKGIEHYYLPPGVYEKECYKANPVDEFKHDIVFVGSHQSYHPEHPFRMELVNWLKQTYGDRVKFYPNHQYPCIRGHKLNELYASSKIVIGDSLDSPMYVSDRVTETLGRGGFLLHPTNEALDKMGFVSGKHLITYSRKNFNDLKGKIDYWLEYDEERKIIRNNGQKFVKENHTYTNRMNEMLKELRKYV